MIASEEFHRQFGRRLRIAFVGGADGIGDVHRLATRLDGMYEIVAGAFSSSPDRSRSFGISIGLPEDRSYGSWRELLRSERDREDGADIVSVLTPNDSHMRICAAALEGGFHVMCEKPITTDLPSAIQLLRKSSESRRVLAVAYCYTGYPMVRQARAMVREGILGDIRQIHVEYVQGWAAEAAYQGWRMDPGRVGASSILIDIGTHAFHMASFVSGLEADTVCADLCATIPGREADDYGAAIVRYTNGARGNFWVTSAARGSEHGLMFRIFGEHGGLEWHQETPNSLTHMKSDGTRTTMTRRKRGVLSAKSLRLVRTEIGHPEGYLEAFANLYVDLATRIANDDVESGIDSDLPGAMSGVEGLAFVEAAVESRQSGRWASISDRLAGL